MQAGQNICGQVELVSVTEFSRVNHHIPSKYNKPIVENFLCITMRKFDGTLLVNMTKEGTKFADDIKGLQSGDMFYVGCKFKELRNDATYGERVAVTNCVLGGFKASPSDKVRDAKKAKRLAALGL